MGVGEGRPVLCLALVGVEEGGELPTQAATPSDAKPVVQLVPEKKAASTLSLSKPDMGPASSPSERAAMMR